MKFYKYKCERCGWEVEKVKQKNPFSMKCEGCGKLGLLGPYKMGTERKIKGKERKDENC